jgi:hypothetical protein
MELRNFQLEEPSHAIALIGLDAYWDLHAFADLEEIRYFTVENTVELRWRAPDVSNPWGDEQNHAKGCCLRFTDVSLLKIHQSDVENTNEDDCVSSVSMIDTKGADLSKPVEFRMKSEWKDGEDSGLLLILQSGRSIEIQARTAELIALS